MVRKILIPLLLVGFICNLSFAEDEFSLLREEQIGTLWIDLPEREVKKTIHCTLKRGPEKLWGADGAYHQKWEYAGCGITLGMVSEKKGALKSIESITLVSPGNLSTKRGIRIGSTEQEVMEAYRPNWNKEDSKAFGAFVAGSVYGGLMFNFQNGKVSRIFLGAAAE